MIGRRKLLTGSGAAIAVAMPAIKRVRAHISPHIELYLCLDRSGSMYAIRDAPDTQHYIIQRDGHVSALRHPDIIDLLVANQTLVRVVLWSGELREIEEKVVMQVTDQGSAVALADTIARIIPSSASSSQDTRHYTALQAVIMRAQEGTRRIVDISTDESLVDETEEGRCLARSEYLHVRGTTVNVLAVSMDEKKTESLQRCLKTPDGFCMRTSTWDEYATAIQQKIFAELQMA